MNTSIKTAIAALVAKHATQDRDGDATIRLADNSFEEACFDQTGTSELIHMLALDSAAAGSFTSEELADTTDCATRGIDADEWVNSIERALAAKTLFENQ